MEFGVWTLMVLMTPRTETLWGLGSKLISSDPTPLFLGVLGVLFLVIVCLATASFVAFCKKKVDQKRRERARKSRRVAILRGARYHFSLAELQQIQSIRNLQRSPLETYCEDPHWELPLYISPPCRVCRNKVIPAPPHGPPAPKLADPSGSLPPSTIPMARPAPVTSAAHPGKTARIPLACTVLSTHFRLPGLARTPLCGLQSPSSLHHPGPPHESGRSPSVLLLHHLFAAPLLLLIPPLVALLGVHRRRNLLKYPTLLSGPQPLPPSETLGHTTDLCPFPVCASGPPHRRGLYYPPEHSRRRKMAPHIASVDTENESRVSQGQRQQGSCREQGMSLVMAAEASQNTAPPVGAVPAPCYSEARTLNGQQQPEPCALSPSPQAVDTQHTQSGRPRLFLNFRWKIRSPRRFFQRRQSPRVGRYMRALMCFVPCLCVQNDL